MLRAELHVHSTFSDGRDNVRALLRAAIEKSIDIISITDHDTVQGSLEAFDLVCEEKLPIKVLPGVEVTTSSGHLLIYGITKDIEPRMDMKETCRIAREYGGLCFLAHPFDVVRGGSVRLRDFLVVDGVEAFNSKSYFNFLAKRYARKFSKPSIGGSDAHSTNSVGRVINFLPNADLHALLNASYEGRKTPFRERLASLLFRLNPRL